MALISTVNLNSVEVLQQLNDLKQFSPDGKNKSYDDSGIGQDFGMGFLCSSDGIIINSFLSQWLVPCGSGCSARPSKS